MSDSVLTSRHNPQLQQLRTWLQHAGQRRRDGVVLLEGWHLLQVCLLAGWHPQKIYVASDTPLVQHLQPAAYARWQQHYCPVQAVEPALLQSITSMVHGSAVLTVLERPHTPHPEHVLPRTETDVLVLESLQDPGNMGTLLRTAWAAGLRQVLCNTAGVDPWSPKVLRAAQGAHFYLQVLEVDALAARLATGLARPCRALTPHARASIYQQDLRTPGYWLLGNEGQGLSPELLALANQPLHIPMPGAAESLNVAMAGGIALFEQIRQRQYAAAGPVLAD